MEQVVTVLLEFVLEEQPERLPEYSVERIIQILAFIHIYT